MFKKRVLDKSSETDVLKNILPLNSVPSKFSELDIEGELGLGESIAVPVAVGPGDT